ncbi:MAG: bifunctional phosphoribosylaminoimidazolecarboxamide formyltransferase/IMP cyclohydrolase [Chloroflexota bacterium]
MSKRALISVSDKTGVVEFGRALAGLGYEIISTGGTMKALQAAGVPVRQVSEVAGFPEILDGRVKTLQPGIHGGILARRDLPEHMAQLSEHGIVPIDLVCVNLYPFRETIAKEGVTLADAIENIDIGGPAMVRSAAKNYAHVAIVVDPADYSGIIDELASPAGLSVQRRFALARKAFQHTAAYDAAIAAYLGGVSDAAAADASQAAPATAGNSIRPPFPTTLQLTYEKVLDCRYGENPHQAGAFYREAGAPAGTIALARQLHGKELSFNNINDANAALELVKEFTVPAAVAVKHANPCGVGTGETLLEAYQRAYEGDTVSIFGGILAFNRELDLATAQAFAKVFLEIVIAPSYAPDALEFLQAKKKDLRILVTGPWDSSRARSYELKRVAGGLLVQEDDVEPAAAPAWDVVTPRRPDARELADLQFAWKVVKHVKSNAIVLARDLATIGVGAGQLNRIYAARLAIQHAGPDKCRGAVLASDAFFPFPDVVAAAADAGVTAIVQPGGAKRDDDSVKLAAERGIAMVFTGIRHFRH